MKFFIKYVFFLFLFQLVGGVFAQSTIWIEDFTTEANNAIVGNNDNTTNPLADWNRTCPTCTAIEASVQGNRFRIQDSDETITWTSEVISLAGFSNIGASVEIDMTGGNLDAPDCITVSYRLNGGPITQFPVNGNVCDDQASVFFASVSGLTGATLQIIITGITTNTNEDIFFDNVTVTGQLPSPPLAFDIYNNLPATKVYGQPNFTTNTAGTTISKTDNSYHTTVDKNTGKVFISEVGNNRVLRYPNIEALTNGQPAEAVFGQPDFVSNGVGTTASTMRSPTGIHIGNDGVLWVADFDNHRVLKFNNASTKPSSSAADGVLGQPNFTTNTANVTQNGMRNPICPFMEDDGTLWVAELNNQRLTRFNNASAKANGANADGVLGKTDFVTNGSSSTQNLVGAVSGVSVDRSGRVYISDLTNNRILWWDNGKAKANGANADGVLCQPNFTNNTAGLAQSKVSSPRMVTVTPDGQFLAVSDDDNERILIFLNPGGTSGLVGANFVFGQPNFTSATPNNGGLSNTSISNPRGIYFYQTPFYENYLFVSDRGNNRTKLYVLFDLFYTTDALTPISDTLQSTELDGDILTFTILDSTKKGSIVLNNPLLGTFTYTPIQSAIDYSDTLLYQVCDKDGCDTSVVIFNILSAIKLWLRADSGVIGSPISAWENIAVVNDSVYSPATRNPLLINNRINFNPALRFDGVNDHFTDVGIVNTISNVQTSVFAVSIPRVQKNQFLYYEKLSGVNRYATRDLYGDGRAYFDAGTTNELSVPWGGTTGRPNIWSFVQKTTIESIGRDGLTIASKAGGTVLGNRSNLFIGSDSVNFYNGDIAELFLFQQTIGDTFELGQIENIETYLAIKYGITLNQTIARDYMYADNDTLTVGTNIYAAESTHDLYDHDIAGIGYDSSYYYLDQPKSMSINTDATVIMERESSWKNLSFIVWGNNDSALTVKNTQIPAGARDRLRRQWKVDSTGLNGTVKISFYVNTYKGLFSNQEYKLLRDMDGDFSNASIYTNGMTISANGDTVSFSGVQFLDNEYFTLSVGSIPIPMATSPHCGAIFVSDTVENSPMKSARLWLRADRGTSTLVNGTPLTSWSDQSFNLFYFEPNGGAGVQPTYKNNITENINFNPTIDFDGGDELFDTTVLGTSNNKLTVFLVAQEDARATNSIFRFKSSTVVNPYLAEYPSLASITRWLAGGIIAPNAITNLAPITVGVPSIGRFTNSLAGNTQQVFVNGATLVADGSGHNITGLDYTYLGNGYNGKIAEFIVIDSLVPLIDVNKIETYLALKYGVQIAHNYVSFKDGNVIYDITNGYANGIFGIGNNRSFDFNQPKSKSVTGYSGVTVQATVAMGDENYLVIGHNGGALTRITVNGQANTLTRKWYGNMTGGVGTVNVELDLAAIGANTGLAPSAVKIGISNSPALTNIYWQDAASVAGGIATFNGVNLYDKYFTFSAAP